MREIKFRAWDKTMGQMMVFSGIFNKKPHTETSTFPQYESIPLYHDIIIMQFSGLKDKNDKEIYEGDIIKLGSINGKYTQGVIVYRNCAFVIEVPMQGDKQLHASLVCDPIYNNPAEIIGNIYESPELLKGRENGKD